jgi:hypothetical protein
MYIWNQFWVRIKKQVGTLDEKITSQKAPANPDQTFK